MPEILVLAEHDGRRLNPNASKCISCAVEIDASAVDVAVFAAQDDRVAAEAASLAGVRRVLNVVHASCTDRLAASLAPQAAEIGGSYTHVLGPSSTFGKDLMPRVAALLGTGQLSDIMAVEAAYRFKRPTYAGNAIVTVEARPDAVLVATVRTASYAVGSPRGGAAEIEQIRSAIDVPTHTRYVGLESQRGELPDLQTAARVVAGGRGLGSKDNFALIERLAGKLGAAIGASRAAVDAGFAPNDFQVGQTGKIIAPQLYVAVGISGAIQHVTGIKDAGTIVAINKDPDAPLFELADIGLVADLFEAVPELTELLDAQSG